MHLTTRILFCSLLLIIHYVLVFLPASELFIIYIFLFNPRWFRVFLTHAALKERRAMHDDG